MIKQDRLCKYVDRLINMAYCGQPLIHAETRVYYEKIVDGLKEAGFTLDYLNPTRFKDIKVWKWIKQIDYVHTLTF